MNNLSPEDIQWLKELANEIQSQNNRATGNPYYYVIKKQKRVVGMDSRYSDKTVWVDMASGEYEEFDSEEDAIKAEAEHNNGDRSKAEAYVSEHYEEFGVYEYDERQNIFLTYKGLLDHIRLNGHNISRSIDPDKPFIETEKVHSFIEHAFRNPEMKRLIEIILKFGDNNETV